MGYGPCDENRFGWCWRNEHGNGRRMTPYFKTEEIAIKFHDYAGVDLRKTRLSDIIEMAEEFAGFNC